MVFRVVLLVFFVAVSAQCVVAQAGLDSMLTLVDRAVDGFDTYVSRKESRISFLRGELGRAVSLQSRYEIENNLYEEYLPFVKDSALFFLDLGIATAEEMGDVSKVLYSKARKSLLCSSTGSFIEAINILEASDTVGADAVAMAAFYRAKCQAYNEISYYSPIEEDKRLYKSISDDSRRRFYAVADPDDSDVLFSRELDALDANELDTSLAINDRWLAGITKGSHPYALATLYRYLEYKARRDTAEMMYWLGESVLTDVRRGVMDQGSMWEMANQIMLMGQVDRSYRYICFTSDCANRFGSRQRLSQISPLLTSIARQYKSQVEEQKSRMAVTIVVISVLSLSLLGMLMYVVRQRDRLKVMRDDLARGGEEMARLNECLRASNSHLTEVSKVRDVYMGRFMGLCSKFADRLDDLRQKVSNRLKKQQMQELYQLIRSEEFQTNYQNELYRTFDEAFLQIFPDFVVKLNALLRPDAQLEQPAQGGLSAQIRVFAMIRLGITDSGQISEFLSYSVNTIYNYRAQVKRGAIVDKAEFERLVMEIEA